MSRTQNVLIKLVINENTLKFSVKTKKNRSNKRINCKSVTCEVEVFGEKAANLSLKGSTLRRGQFDRKENVFVWIVVSTACSCPDRLRKT